MGYIRFKKYLTQTCVVQELETATRLKLNLTILVLNDNGYGMIKWKQNLAGFDK
jgi:thiamine pyrophosphate-dependent acetolactate synthase large subunit-like protein